MYLSQSVLQQGKKQVDIGDETQDPCILSYLADCDFNVRLRNTSHSFTETTEGSSFSSEDQKSSESRNVTPPSNQRTLSLALLRDTGVEREQRDILRCQPFSRRTLDILQETPHADSALSVPSCPLDQQKGDSRSFTFNWSHPSAPERQALSAGQRGLKDGTDASPDGGCIRSIEKTVQALLHLLKSRHPGPTQLDELEYQVFCIRDKLKVMSCFALAVLCFLVFCSQR